MLLLRASRPSRLKNSFAGLMVLVAGTACAWQPNLTPRGEDAWLLLRRVFAEPFPMDVVAIQDRLPTDGRSPVLVKLIVSKRRSLVSQVLQPTARQGYVVLDDGSVLKSYDPDSKTITTQPSPNLYRPKLSDRMQWAKENYDATIEGTDDIAGRKGVVVRLKPHYSQVPGRRMTVDMKQPFLLRSEKISGGEWLKTVDTKDVTYGRSSEHDNLEELFPDDSRTETTWGPKPVAKIDPAGLATALGFTPEEPDEIPYGFHVVTRSAVGSSWDDASLAYRLSDGVATVTVYAWSPSKVPSGPPGTSSLKVSGKKGVRFSAIGDVPRNVLKDLATAFSRAERSAWELTPGSDSLPRIFERPSRRITTIPPSDLNE